MLYLIAILLTLVGQQFLKAFKYHENSLFPQFSKVTIGSVLKKTLNVFYVVTTFSRDNTTTDARMRLWKFKIVKINSVAPKLESLPLTDEAFSRNI